MIPLESEFFIVIDIEASGPSPDLYAMLSLGAATLTEPAQTFYREFQPDSELVNKESLEISNLSMQELAENAHPPKQALQQFSQWIQTVTPSGKIPIFTAFNAPFDWMFVNTYFHRYLGYNPFGHKALDIKALFMGYHQVPFLNTSHYEICEHYNLHTLLTHHALEDAIQEAELLKLLLQEIFNYKEKK